MVGGLPCNPGLRVNLAAEGFRVLATLGVDVARAPTGALAMQLARRLPGGVIRIADGLRPPILDAGSVALHHFSPSASFLSFAYSITLTFSSALRSISSSIRD